MTIVELLRSMPFGGFDWGESYAIVLDNEDVRYLKENFNAYFEYNEEQDALMVVGDYNGIKNYLDSIAPHREKSHRKPKVSKIQEEYELMREERFRKIMEEDRCDDRTRQNYSELFR